MRNHPMWRFNSIIIIILLFVFFLVGLKIGGDYTISSTNLFEQAKEEFEEDIVKPNNDYQTKILYPEEKMPNKIAHKVDEVMQKVINKLLSREE